MKLYKNPDNSWTLGTLLSVPSGTCFIEEISADVYAIRFINAPSNIFIGAITDLERSDESPYEDIATFLLECGDFFVNPLNPLKEDVEGLQEDVNQLQDDVSAIQGGYLGTLLHTDAAPEPGASGIYKFISAGVVSWLSGTPTVAVGDEVSVVFTNPTYTYTHIQNPYELLANKQNSLAADGTGAKYPTVDAVNAGLALKVAYADSLKYYPVINYGNRVLADSGVISDLEKLTKLYIENLKLLDNTVFMWDGSAGIKTRTSEVNQYAIKLYDMSEGNRDAVQATEANQPFVGGGIAPNEKRRLKNLIDNKVLVHPNITIDSTGANGFSITTVLKATFENVGTASNKGLYLAGMFVNFTSMSIGIFNETTNSIVWIYPTNKIIGKSKIITITANSVGIFCYVDGILIPISSGTYTPFSSVLSGLFNNSANDTFAGEIYHHQIFNKALSAAEVQAQHAYLRLQYPEIEGINIGNQHWATSNYEGVVTGNGTVIPEVQGASTATNPELITNGTFDTATGWILAGATTISGGALRVYSPDGSSSFARFNIPTIVVGKRYLLKYDVLQNNGGEISCTDIGSNIIDTTVGVNKTFEFTVADVGYFILKRIGACDVTFDNVSLKAVGWADLTTPAWCYYNNDPLNGAVYGKLYNWYAVQAIAANPPEGWRVPTQADYVQLSNHLGGNSVAGGKMRKEGLYPYYNNENVGATNESGFSGIGCGYRTADGNSTAIRYGLFLHTNSIYTAVLARDTTVLNIQAISEVNKKLGYSLRLIRNEPVGATERNIETGYITNALGATNLDIPIPFGYQVESIRIDSETNITGLSAKLFTGALVELETLFTAKSVTANVQKVIAADADQSIQQTDAVVRINGTKALTSARFRVWVKITKVVFS